MLYIHKKNTSDNQLHSVIIKRTKGEWEFVLALGYGGGNVNEEFCGKFKFDEQRDRITGYVAKYCDAFEWECKILGSEVIGQNYESIDEQDRTTILEMVDELFNLIELNEEQNQYNVKGSFQGKFQDEIYYSQDWTIDYVDLISNYHWGLTLRFDY